MLRQIQTDFRHVKTYATKKALMKRIAEDMNLYPDHNDRFLVVRTPEGRWTVIVSLDMTKGGYVGRYEFLKI